VLRLKKLLGMTVAAMLRQQKLLRHCTKINDTFIHIPSLTGRLNVAGDIPFYQHSVPDGTSDATTLSF
jgi:hypothetical protein